MRMDALQRGGRRAAMAAVALLMTGCASLLRPDAVTLSEAELARLMARSFPLDRRVLEVLDLRVEAPRLALLPERNRVGVQAAVQGRDRLFGGAWTARLDFDSQLRFEIADQSLRLSAVRVHGLVLDAGERADGGQDALVRRVGPVLAERLLEGLVIYRLSPERAQALARQGVRPSAVQITPAGVEIRFAPPP